MEHITEKQFIEILAKQVRLHGTYVVTGLLAKVTQVSSDMHKEAGNMDAVIHMDNMAIQTALLSMKHGHPLRY